MAGFEMWLCCRCWAEGSGKMPPEHPDACAQAQPTVLGVSGVASKRIAALEQHVSDLEKSLENARKERDAARADLEGWRGERAALNLQVRNATAERDAALAHVARLDADYLLAQQEISSASADLSAALADNAAKDEALGAISTTLEDKALRVMSVSQHTVDAQRTVIETAHRLATEARVQPHPGAALLEELETLRGRQALWEEAATALYGYAEFIGPCAHGRDPWDRCDECGEKNAVYAAAKAYAQAQERVKRLEEALRAALACELGWEDTEWGRDAAELVGRPRH